MPLAAAALMIASSREVRAPGIKGVSKLKLLFIPIGALAASIPSYIRFTNKQADLSEVVSAAALGGIVGSFANMG